MTSNGPMRLRVLLFSTYREIVGAEEISWTADSGTTVRSFQDAFLQAHPKLDAHRGSMMIAVNYSIAEPSTLLHDGDEVALLPPVSGGAA